MLPRDDSIEDKFKKLLNDNPLGATARTRFLWHLPSIVANGSRCNKSRSSSL
jgi:hypothetical protein